MRLTILILVVCAVGMIGCQGPTALPREFADIGKAVAASMTDQAVWKSVTANVDGQVINPGIRVQAGVLYIADAQLTGVSGQVGVRGVGDGSGGATDAGRKAVLSNLAKNDAIKEAIAEAVREALSRLTDKTIGPATSQPSN